ncbi:hypothetical protein [Sinomonas humi]|uniref:Uncharacterized protein n=1 Tax=Sinomonas humi TaxID=1338436 RepID=A0A0B2APL9_9MICC|nr:hypothetical protein [Sinomonas humi]KHL03934.1 hypothetical protein LK10_07720 [Sinomonas humi]
MDDATVVANLVYGGTLIIGGVMLLIIFVSLVGTMLIAGFTQTLISLVKLGSRLFVYRPERTTPAEEAAPAHVRNAVLAKADAILAASRVQAEESAAVAKTEEAAAAEAERIRRAAKTEAEKAPAARATAVAEKAARTLAFPERTGPFTGTQPLVKAG